MFHSVLFSMCMLFGFGVTDAVATDIYFEDSYESIEAADELDIDLIGSSCVYNHQCGSPSYHCLRYRCQNKAGNYCTTDLDCSYNYGAKCKNRVCVD